MGHQMPLSLARRNLQANEDADCGGSKKILKGASHGEGITGRKEKNWESWFGACAEQLQVASSECKFYTYPEEFIVRTGHL